MIPTEFTGEIEVCDLYDGAFLLSLGAHFKHIVSYYRNMQGKAFSVMLLIDVTPHMLNALYDQESTVNFHKFRSFRKKLKEKAEEYAHGHAYGELNSSQIYQIRQRIKKYHTIVRKIATQSKPKRIMQFDDHEKTL